MFNMAIYYKDINTPRSLIVRILFSFLPFTFYFNIVSYLRISDVWFIEHAIMKNNSSTVQSTYRSMKYNEFINVSNSKYTSYKSQVALGNKDLLADFSNAITKIRRGETTLKGLANGMDLKEGTFLLILDQETGN